jgi:hypothetical protein
VPPDSASPLLARYLESSIDPERHVPDAQVEIRGNLDARRRLLAEVRR